MASQVIYRYSIKLIKFDPVESLLRDNGPVGLQANESTLHNRVWLQLNQP